MWPLFLFTLCKQNLYNYQLAVFFLPPAEAEEIDL